MHKENNSPKTFDYNKALKISPDAKKDPVKWVDLFLNRPMAALIVRAVFNTRVTPNGLTYTSFFMGLIGAYLLSRGQYLYLVLGGVLAQLSSIVDGADGMLARAKDMSSPFGTYLDLFFDRIIDFSTFVGIAVGTYIYFNNINLLVFGLLAAGLYLLQVNLLYIRKTYAQNSKTGETGEMRAIMIWGILIFAVADRLDIFIYAGLIMAAASTMFHIMGFLRMGRK